MNRDQQILTLFGINKNMVFVGVVTGITQLLIAHYLCTVLLRYPDKSFLIIGLILPLPFMCLKWKCQRDLRVKKHPTNSYFSVAPLTLTWAVVKMIAREVCAKIKERSNISK